jgi:hypothetical protein
MPIVLPSSLPDKDNRPLEMLQRMDFVNERRAYMVQILY